MFLAKVPNTTVLRFFLLEKEIAPRFVPTTTMLSGVLTETSDLIGVKTSSGSLMPETKMTKPINAAMTLGFFKASRNLRRKERLCSIENKATPCVHMKKLQTTR